MRTPQLIEQGSLFPASRDKAAHDDMTLATIAFLSDPTFLRQVIPIFVRTRDRFVEHKAAATDTEEYERYRPHFYKEGNYTTPQPIDDYSDSPPAKLRKFEIEQVLTLNKRIVGYCDLVAEFAICEPKDWVDVQYHTGKISSWRGAGKQRKPEYTWEPTHWQRTLGGWRDYRKTCSLWLEVKPSIESLGDLLKQINTYRKSDEWARHSDRQFAVVAPPDQRAEAVLRSQGVHYLAWCGPDAPLLFLTGAGTGDA